MRIRHTQRCDLMLLLSVLSTALLTLLGTAGESLGYDRWLTEPVNDIETVAVSIDQNHLVFCHNRLISNTK